MSDKIVVPHFASESEEADWWFAHREEHGESMAQAIAEGHATGMQQLLARHGAQAPRVTVQFDFEDVVRAREQAAVRGMDFEVYVRDLLHDAVEKNSAA
jgi:predicted DNA binding CopG/RHH family protein